MYSLDSAIAMVGNVKLAVIGATLIHSCSTVAFKLGQEVGAWGVVQRQRLPSTLHSLSDQEREGLESERLRLLKSLCSSGSSSNNRLGEV